MVQEIKMRFYRNVTKNLMRNKIMPLCLMHDFSGNNKTLDAFKSNYSL